MYVKSSTAGWLIILAIFLVNIFGGGFVTCFIYGVIFAILLSIFSVDFTDNKDIGKNEKHHKKTKQ